VATALCGGALMSLSDVRREFREIPLGLIDEPILPSRTMMDEQQLDELAADIGRKGLLQPMIVAAVNGRYEVIAGHRRRLACGRAGLVAAPCIVYPSKETALEGVKYSENRFRENLNAADEAILFDELLERDCGGDVDRLCEQLGEKRGYVEGRLLLLSGDRDVFNRLRTGDITIGVAQQLNRCTDPSYRRYLLHQAIVGGATVAVVSGWIADWQRQRVASGDAPAPAPSTVVPSAIPETNFFTCAVCGGTDNVHLMRPINVHTHCQLAILDKLLAVYRGDTGGDPIASDPRRI
jgi:ParB/RepB/Spo0J family partition protein